MRKGIGVLRCGALAVLVTVAGYDLEPNQALAKEAANPAPVEEAEDPGEPLAALRNLLEERRYDEVERVGRPLLEQVENEHGERSLEVAEVLDVLVDARRYGGLAGDPESLELARRAVELKEANLGPEHPGVATSLKGLGHILGDVGELDQAESAYRRAIAIREKALGPDHPEVAKLLANLGGLMSDKGRLADAIVLTQRSLDIMERALGPEDPILIIGLSNLGSHYESSEDYEKSRQAYERALAIAENSYAADHPRVAISLRNLGLNFYYRGDYATAKDYFERALAILEPILDPIDPMLTGTHVVMGIILLNTGAYAEAEEILLKALEASESYGEASVVAVNTLRALVQLYVKTGDHAAVRRFAMRRLAIEERVHEPDSPVLAGARADAGMGLLAIGDYRSARDELEQALQVLERSPGYEDHVAVAAFNLGTVYAYLGQPAAARRNYERALEIEKRLRGPDHPEIAVTLGTMAVDYLEMGDLPAGEELLIQSLEITEKAVGADNPRSIPALGSLAGLYFLAGDLERARELFEKVASMQEAALGPDSPMLARTLSSLGWLAIRQGDLASAEKRLERARSIYAKSTGFHPESTKCLSNLAIARRAQGDMKASKKLFEQALATNRQYFGAESVQVAEVLNELAILHWRTGDLGEALATAIEAGAMAGRQFSQMASSLSQREALRFEAARGAGMDTAMAVLTVKRDDSPKLPVFDVWDQVVRSRATVLDQIGSRHRETLGDASPEIVALTRELEAARNRLARLVVGEVSGEDTEEPFDERVREAQLDRDNAERALAAKSPGLRPPVAREEIGLAEVFRSVPPGGALVAFARYGQLPKVVEDREVTTERGSAYLAFVLRHGDAKPRVVPLGSADDIDELVGDWRRAVGTNPTVPGVSPSAVDTAYSKAAGALRKKIWDPIRAAIAGAETLLIVPDGALNLVSFATLPDDKGRYVVETGPVLHYLSSERDLASRRPVGPRTGLLVLGDPSFDRKAASLASLERKDESDPETLTAELTPTADLYRSPPALCSDLRSVRFGALPGTRAEAIEVGSLWRESAKESDPGSGRVLRLAGEQVGEEIFKHYAAGFDTIHIATHGFFVHDRCRSWTELPSDRPRDRAITGGRVAEVFDNPMLLSGLAMAGANLRNRPEASDRNEDGMLTAEEIASLDLTGARWVVLSACETGVGDVVAGEGVLGLQRAFRIAGAATVIMSLWRVEDAASREWMRALYRSRLAGASTPDAMRTASVTVLEARRRGDRSTHPFFWGAFVASGDPR